MEVEIDDVKLRSEVLQSTLFEISQRQSEKEDKDDGATVTERAVTEREDCCVICLERITEKAVTRPCQHSAFDFICLVSWLQQRSSCPLCNAEVATIHYGFEEDGNHKVYAVAPTFRSKSVPTSPGGGTEQSLPHRLQRRRRPLIAGGTPQPDGAVERRRKVYREMLYSLHVGSNDISGYEEFTPRSVAASTELQSRARKWIRRELKVFRYLYPDAHRNEPAHSSEGESSVNGRDRRANNAEFLLEYIIAILKTIDLQGPTGQAQELLKEFLGREHSVLFLHELRNWVRSPYNTVEEWDKHVQYRGLPKGSEMATDSSTPRLSSSTQRAAVTDRAGSRYSPYPAVLIGAARSRAPD